jgi:cell division protein FtsB
MLLAGGAPAKFVGMAMAIECARCKAQSADGKKFCGECGNPLDAAIPAFKDPASPVLRDQVHEIIEQHYKDQKVVEIETTQAIATRLLDWAKLLAFFVGIPITVLLLILGVFGIKTYNDFSTQVDKAKADVAAAELAATNLKSRTASIDSDYQKLSAKISDTRTALEEQVKTLSARVDVIGEKVGFTPTSKISKETKLRLEDAFSRFRDYVKNLGYRSAAGSTFGVDVREQMSGGSPAYYDPDKRKLIIGKEYVGDFTILDRAYMLQVLSSSSPDLNLIDYSAIYSGLATYFSYSFADNPRPNPDSWDLTKKRPFIDLKSTDNSVLSDGTEIWGSAFWELRTILGQNVADKLLLDAWFGLHAEQVRADRGASFVRKLMDLDKAHEAEIRGVFAQRGLSL